MVGFGKPVQIGKGANTVAIAYGPDRGRFKRVDMTGSGTTIIARRNPCALCRSSVRRVAGARHFYPTGAPEKNIRRTLSPPFAAMLFSPCPVDERPGARTELPWDRAGVLGRAR